MIGLPVAHFARGMIGGMISIEPNQRPNLRKVIEELENCKSRNC